MQILDGNCASGRTSAGMSLARCVRKISGAITADRCALDRVVRAALLLLIASEAAAAPCKQCVLDVPVVRPDAAPVLVVLHGDRELATAAATRWRAATREAGVILLSLQCPRDKGCKDSWWQWDGDTRWVLDQVDALARDVAIDPARIYLAGWSGGASYIGARAQEWTGTFAAVVIHGGGMAPQVEACAPRALPAYFLVGDKNPLHRLAVELRGWFDGCKQDVVWDLVTGGDHDKEDRALDKHRAAAILAWLRTHHRGP